MFLAIWLIIDPDISLVDQQIESYVVFFLVLYTIRIIEFFSWIRKSIFDDARTFLSSRGLMEKKNVNELELELIQIEAEAKNDASLSVKINIVKA